MPLPIESMFPEKTAITICLIIALTTNTLK